MNRHMEENGIFKNSLESNSLSLTHKPFLGVNFSVSFCIVAVIRCLNDRFQGSPLPVGDLKCYSSIFLYGGY